jgi:hypothetical protein
LHINAHLLFPLALFPTGSLRDALMWVNKNRQRLAGTRKLEVIDDSYLPCGLHRTVNRRGRSGLREPARDLDLVLGEEPGPVLAGGVQVAVEGFLYTVSKIQNSLSLGSTLCRPPMRKRCAWS